MSYDVGGLGLAGEKSGKRKRYLYIGIAAVVVVVVIVAAWALMMRR
jgi:flagellar basal body-associated protein FliL